VAEIRSYGSPSFNFNFTTKIIEVPSPANAAVQDIWNAIVKASADIQSMDDEEIATISGKEALGGGQFVGITLSLINGWRLQFEAQGGPDWVRRTVSGGNVVTSQADQAPAGGPAVGDADDPIAPSAYVTATIAQSVSGTLSDRQDIDNKYLIESQRNSHQATGESYYWDPVNGDDSNDGQTPTTARATFTSIHDDLVSDSHHDVVFIVPGNASGQTIATENITISKRFTFLRGPGYDFRLQPSNQSVNTITISAEGVEVHGFEVVGPSTAGCAIEVDSATDYRISRMQTHGGDCAVWVHDSQTTFGHGRITQLFAHHTGDHGILIEDSIQWEIEDVTIHDAGGSGIYIDAATPLQQDSYIRSVRCFSNTGYGIAIATSNVSDILVSNPALSGNTAGRLLDNGTNTTFSDDSERIRQVHLESFGRWALDKAAGTLTLYDDDGVTALQVFNLLDENGTQVTDGQNIYERSPV